MSRSVTSSRGSRHVGQRVTLAASAHANFQFGQLAMAMHTLRLGLTQMEALSLTFKLTRLLDASAV